MSDLSVPVLDDRTLLGTYFCDDAPSVTMHLGWTETAGRVDPCTTGWFARRSRQGVVIIPVGL